jgi:hypothetical protein
MQPLQEDCVHPILGKLCGRYPRYHLMGKKKDIVTINNFIHI